MTYNNPFVLPTDDYVRDVDVLKHYVRDSALYLQKMTGQSLEVCSEFIKNSLRPGGKFQFKDPEILYLERGDNGDRVKKEGTLSVYLKNALKQDDLIAPTLTTYLSPTKQKSLLVSFIDGNVKARGAAKKAQFAAKVAGDKTVERIKKIEQTNKKLSNNSISGAHVSASTPLCNKTAHNTLTSNCRSTSGYGNANNEKFLCGNRHYHSPDIVRNNIISIINNSDFALIQTAMDQYGIRHPTVEETIACVKYSAELYWRTQIEYVRIENLINTLTDIERSAFVYTGDLYHLMKLNDGVVRELFSKLSKRVEHSVNDSRHILDDAPDDIKHLAVQICAVDMKKEIKEGMDGITINNVIGTAAYDIVAATVENIINTMEEYRTLIRAFWVTKNVPASVAYFPDSIRRSAITSDTDSTIFTVQDWVVWYTGKLGFDPISNAISDSAVFLAAQTITHVLAKMSINFGIEKKRLYQIAMKNEFKFDIFVPTQVAKHYFALISCQEGNLFKNYEREIKGVHLKSSNVAKSVMKEAERMMIFIMDSIVAGKLISLQEIYKWIADIEREIMKSIEDGSFSFFRKAQIKNSSAYKEGAQSAPYQQYGFWNEVFGPKYGIAPEPPYMGIKVSGELDSPLKTKEWIAAIEDKELAARLEAWLLKNNRKHVGKTFVLPEQIITSVGIPKEILDAIHVRKIVHDTTSVFYIILETLGVYIPVGKKLVVLVSDTY